MSVESELATETTLDPSKLSFESVWTRRRILASYWLVVMLAVPLWWRATSIDRLSLPESRVRALSSKQLSFPIQVHLKSELPNHPAAAVAKELEASLENEVRRDDTISLAIIPSAREVRHTEGYEVTLIPGLAEPTIHDRSLNFEIQNETFTATLRAHITSIMLQLLVPPPTLSSSITHRVVKYAPRYRLAFTLLNQDAASGKAAITWDAHNSINRYLGSTLDRLSVLHNFTIESQIQFHAPLAFDPIALAHDNQQAFGLTQEDLTVFVNSAEWTLSSSVSNDPVLHFVVFVPSVESSPLHILDHSGAITNSNAFILPQWGGIFVLNRPKRHMSSIDLQDAFTTFNSQLLALLGVPVLPPSIRSSDAEEITDWQLDALIRQRALENIKESKETLQSIVSLVNQIQNMPVGQGVKGDIQNALNALDQVYTIVSSSTIKALHHSAEALALSSRAFFNPGMLALLYFPAEHTYAVYTPLFASVAAPLVAAVLREVAAWRRSRKQKVSTAEGKPKSD